MLVREAAGRGFEYAEQPLSGIAVALAPFREASGKLRAYVSVAPPVNLLSDEVAGFPPGDGELLRQTESGWQDLSRSQYAGNAIARRRGGQERSRAGGRHRPEWRARLGGRRLRRHRRRCPPGDHRGPVRPPRRLDDRVDLAL